MYLLKMVTKQKTRKMTQVLARFQSLDRALYVLGSMANEEYQFAAEQTTRAAIRVLENGWIQVKTGKRSERIFLIQEGS